MKIINPCIHNNFLDGMVLNGTEEEFSDIREILEICNTIYNVLMLPWSVKAEIDNPKTPQYVKKRASELLYTAQVNITFLERDLLGKITKIIQGNAKLGKHEKDAFHIFECDKYGGGHFLTKDTRLLKKSRELESSGLIELLIISPRDFLEKLKQFTQK